MKLGVSQHFDKSDHLPMMTPSSNTGESATPKNSTVPNQKTPKKKASERVLFCVKKQHKYRYRRETKKKPM